MEKQCCKRVLILSNECLSARTANGRTLANFFVGYPKECLAQFSLQSVAPDFERCENYFCVSDGEALQAFVKGKKVGKRLENKEESATSASGKARSRTALTMLLRDMIWNSGRWKKGGFTDFVREFDPQVILVQAGDCAFMLRLARKLAKQYKIPLVVYNSEGYYFKKFDYFCGKGLAHWCYPIFRRKFCKEFRKLMKQADSVIYNCSALQQDYSKDFDTPSHVLYTATQLQPSQKTQNEKLRISYLGNLEVGRHASLIRMAQKIGKIDLTVKLDIYGKMPNAQIEKELSACDNINLCGFVTYEKVTEVMQNSDILVHAEGYDDFYREDSKYAFSTKIADSLACGTCFLVYAPQEFACTRYLQGYAYVVSDEEALEQTLKSLICEPSSRKKYLQQASDLVQKNHQAQKNAAKFAEILIGAGAKK